jgi:nucleotide-binding universal stress UspA family protein
MENIRSYLYYAALEDFRRARKQAALAQISARLKGKNDSLLSYEDVRKKLRGIESSVKQLIDIPLEAIIGSVGRYNDFTRNFLPKEDATRKRWVSVKAATDTLKGLPPIEVYKIGEAYFVLDGNHRVSVARQMGMSQIQAYVTEIKTRVPLSAEDDPDSIIIKAEYAQFLEDTHIDEIRPDADLRVTAPGQYQKFEEHIRVHQYFLGLEQKQPEVAYAEAVASFYDHVYLPVVQVVRETGLLREFPERTEADLYLWLAEHRAALQETYDTNISPQRAAQDLVINKSSFSERFTSFLGGSFLKSLVPDEMESGPPTGTWRQTIRGHEREHRLFKDILVPVSGTKSGWSALNQAILVARREQAFLNGLHVVSSEEQLESDDAQAVKAEFENRCAQEGVSGRLSIQTGMIPRLITERTRWNDLVVLNLAFPPGNQPISKLASGVHTILRRSAIPVLLVPDEPTQFQKPLLAFDGSAAAREALFLAAYLIGAWENMELMVISINSSLEQAQNTLTDAQAYFENCTVQVTFRALEGESAETILGFAESDQCDVLITGTYGLSPLLEVVLGSTLDQVLNKTKIPLLVCR